MLSIIISILERDVRNGKHLPATVAGKVVVFVDDVDVAVAEMGVVVVPMVVATAGR